MQRHPRVSGPVLGRLGDRCPPRSGRAGVIKKPRYRSMPARCEPPPYRTPSRCRRYCPRRLAGAGRGCSATLAFTLTAGWLFVRTLPMALEFGTDSDSQYTAWVYSPRASVFFLSFVAGIVTMIVLSFRRWRQPTRNVIFAVFALGTVAGAAWAVHESAARRHIGPALVAAVKSVPRPAGATSSAPVVVDPGTPRTISTCSVSLRRASGGICGTDTEAAACSAERQMVAGAGRVAAMGHLRLQTSTRPRSRDHQRRRDPLDPAATIDVSAYPND